MHKYPQVLLNVRSRARASIRWRCPRVARGGERASSAASTGEGRIVLRASGTEPVIRVMVEGYDAELREAGRAARSPPRSKRRRPKRGGGRRPPHRPSGAAGLAVTRPARLIFAAFPAGRLKAPRWWLCVVRWSPAIGRCTDRGPPTSAARGARSSAQARLAGRHAWYSRPTCTCRGGARCCDGGAIEVGAQDVCAEAAGAFTGEVSAAMLKDVGCRYVIVGHSERRALYHEDDALVARKFAAALQAGPDAGAVRRRDAGGARGGAHRGGGRAAARGGDRAERRGRLRAARSSRTSRSGRSAPDAPPRRSRRRRCTPSCAAGWRRRMLKWRPHFAFCTAAASRPATRPSCSRCPTSTAG